MRRSLRLLAAVLAAVLWSSAPAVEARTLKIVTSSTDLASIAKEIGGDRVETHSFFRGDQEPELWVEEVFPSWIVRAGRADMLVRIGLFADVWMDTVIESAHNRRIVPGAPGHVDASEGIAVLEVPAGRVDRSLGEIHLQGNPHYLLDPANASVVAGNILRALTRLVPDQAEYFRRNAAAFTRKLESAGPRWTEAAARLRGKKLAAYHRTWSYLARRFGLEIVGYCEPKPGIEPSPADLRELTETMARERARLIVHEPVYSPRIPQAVARDVERLTGQRVTVLRLPAHVGGVAEAKDYVAFIDYLVTTLGDALR
jgi:zinc/manganese transport system substrate-binding protein